MALAKPTFVPGPQPGHPLERGLVFHPPLYEGSGPVRDVVGGGTAALGTSMSWTGGDHGASVNCTGGQCLDFGACPRLLPGPTGLTMSVLLCSTIPWASQVGWAPIFGRTDDDSDKFAICFVSGSLYGISRNTAEGARGVYANGLSLVQDTWYVVTFVRDDIAGGIYLYLNGQLVGSNWCTGTQSVRTDIDVVAFAGTDHYWSEYFVGKIGGAWGWNRALCEEEAKLHAADPFSMDRPRRTSYRHVTPPAPSAHRYLRAGFGDRLYTIGVSGGSITGLPAGQTALVAVDHTPAGAPTATDCEFAAPFAPVVTVPIGVTVRVLACGTVGGVAKVTNGLGFVLEFVNVSYSTDYGHGGAGPDIEYSWTRKGILAYRAVGA